jgi:hypothetical protein
VQYLIYGLTHWLLAGKFDAADFDESLSGLSVSISARSGKCQLPLDVFSLTAG